MRATCPDLLTRLYVQFGPLSVLVGRGLKFRLENVVCICITMQLCVIVVKYLTNTDSMTISDMLTNF
jgi:hypothetical protein